MLTRRKGLSLSALLVSQLCVAGVAIAQETTTPPADAAAEEVGGAKKKQVEEEVVVTGSRIRRKDLTTAAPVTVINKEQISASGKVSIGDFLQSLPEQGNAINTSVNNGGDGATRVALRGLGSQRTLVLLNGRRFVPGGTGADASVDLNSIPTAAIERIEVLKDGASAVYGSDAIAGVVNIITRKNYSGVDAAAFAGISGHGDGNIYDLNITAGTSGDRGNITFAAGYYKALPVFAGDREYAAIPRGFDGSCPVADGCGEYTVGSGTIPQGRVVIPSSQKGVANGNALWNSLVTANPKTGAFVRDPSVPLGWRPYNGSAIESLGGDAYNFQPENYLVTPQQRITLYASGNTRLGSFVRGFFEGTYSNRQSDQKLAAEPLLTDSEGVLVSKNNIYNPFGRDFTGTPGNGVRRRLLEFGNRRTLQDVDTFRVVGGFDGTLPEAAGPLAGWFFEASAQYGRTQADTIKYGNLKVPQLAAAVGPSFIDATGRPTCGAVGAVIDGCVPLNLFGGPGSITGDQVTPLTFTGTGRGTNQLSAVNVNTSGELFKLLSDRPVGLALGYEYRFVLGSSIPDPITVAGETTGNKGLITSGLFHSNEGYAELSIPIINNVPGAQAVEAIAAARIFNYSNFGTDYTYKFGGRWQVIRDLTARATYSTAFRAPDIGNLFGGQADNFASFKDPCANAATAPKSCGNAAGNGDDQTQHRSRVGGNPALKPETAKTFTAGLVIEPQMVKDLSITLDYYSISIDQSISTLGENVIIQGCYPVDGGPAPKYCDLIQRDPTSHQLLNVFNLNQNVGGEYVNGMDFAVRYSRSTEFGRFGATFDGTWLFNHDVTQADGSVIKAKGTFDLGAGSIGGVNPNFKFNAGINWAYKGFGAGVTWKFISSFKECGDSTGDFSGLGLCYVDPTFSRTVDAYNSFDLYASYNLQSSAGKTTFAVGMLNFLDAKPALIYNGFLAATDPTAYDLVGRYPYVRISHSY